MNQINGIAVKSLTENKPKHCIVGVPINIDFADIIESMRCESALRVTKTANGTKIPTSVVILNFKGQIPVKVKVGYFSFKIKPFIREPLRCYKCNAYSANSLREWSLADSDGFWGAEISSILLKLDLGKVEDALTRSSD